MHGPFHPSISGGTVIVNAKSSTGPGFDDVFAEPAGGWSGTVMPAARLVAPDGENLGVGAVYGNTVVAFAANPEDTMAFAYVFVEPAQGGLGRCCRPRC
jgi:formylmethanofuran dehydrogenase subunit D